LIQRIVEVLATIVVTVTVIIAAAVAVVAVKPKCNYILGYKPV
jgi:hypothetical protein